MEKEQRAVCDSCGGFLPKRHHVHNCRARYGTCMYCPRVRTCNSSSTCELHRKCDFSNCTEQTYSAKAAFCEKHACKWSTEWRDKIFFMNKGNFIGLMTFPCSDYRFNPPESKFCHTHAMWIRNFAKNCAYCGCMPKMRYVPFLLAREGYISKDIAKFIVRQFLMDSPSDYCPCGKRNRPYWPTSLEECKDRWHMH
jgi:hypothetical protein